jgi:hypothetical protein
MASTSKALRNSTAANFPGGMFDTFSALACNSQIRPTPLDMGAHNELSRLLLER